MWMFRRFSSFLRIFESQKFDSKPPMSLYLLCSMIMLSGWNVCACPWLPTRSKSHHIQHMSAPSLHSGFVNATKRLWTHS